MNPADRVRRRVIEVATPPRETSLVATIRYVDRGCIEPRTRPFANDVDDDRGANQSADLVSDPYPTVLHHHIAIADVLMNAGQLEAQLGEQGTKVLVDRVGIQAV